VTCRWKCCLNVREFIHCAQFEQKSFQVSNLARVPARGSQCQPGQHFACMGVNRSTGVMGRGIVVSIIPYSLGGGVGVNLIGVKSERCNAFGVEGTVICVGAGA